MMGIRWPSIVLLVVTSTGIFSQEVAGQSQDAIDFGAQIQPIFARRCFACHGPDKAEGGLRLDRGESATKALESGTTPIVPKDSAHSEVLRRVTSQVEGERMPPEGAPLTPSQIALLTRWIDEGAAWNEHWAFSPPSPQSPPEVKNKLWIANEIDRFTLAKLEQHGFQPAPPLDKPALLRRVTYDLTGLPPTSAETRAFLADDSPNAYEAVVDRLLQSPRHGEHWARHWLDVVRYADTNSFERDGPKPNAWRFRDYVIRSINDDKPYDRFIREQLAGDELIDGGNDGLIATGFYRLGLWDDEPADRLLAMYDGLDDIITTTSQGFLGLTVNCARCHDHKIDPIPQRDYYSLLAFFQGITPNGNPNPNVERPIFENEDSKRKYEIAVAAREEQLNSQQAAVAAIENEFRDQLNQRELVAEHSDLDELEYRFYRDTWEKLPNFDNLKPETNAKLESCFFDISAATREYSFGFVFDGTLKVPADGEYTFFLDSDDGSRLNINGTDVVVYDGIHSMGQPRSGKLILKQGRVPIRLDYFQGERGSKGLSVQWSGPDFQKRSLSSRPDTPPTETVSKTKRKDFAALIKAEGASVLGARRYEEYTKLKQKYEELKRQKVDANYALCVTELGPNPAETMILKRGNPQSPGNKVVPAFLTAMGGEVAEVAPTAPNPATSGRRLALANWIASPSNRLTARVMVNRLWQHLFGRGIVRSPNNFGLLGDRPTHPELLDWLALEFMKGGPAEATVNPSTLSEKAPGAIRQAPWSMKRMQKLIVMSSTYRMSSRIPDTAMDASNPDARPAPSPRQVDPLNNFFWRHDMRRLGAEEVRDSILAVTGELNPKMYGPGVFPKISDEVKAGQSVPGQGWGQSSAEDQARRSIYVQVKRSLLLPILADFDFADTDGSCAARFTTTQPTQALGMLNGEFLNGQAALFAKRLRRDAGNDPKQQVTLAFQLTLNRDPDQDLVDRGLRLIDLFKTKHLLSDDAALEKFCLMVLNLNEFIYLD